VLFIIAVAFIAASGKFTRYDLVAVAMYVGLAAFAWHPVTAAFAVMLIGSVGVIFTASGGDLIELAIAACLVAATCSRGVIITYGALLVTLTVYLDISSATLTEGGIFGIAGIALISFIAGVSFRLITAREALLVADRARLVSRLEGIAREDQERIADELHDGIAHDLTLVLFHARALPRQSDAVGREVSLTTIEESADRALRSIQSLLSLMRVSDADAPFPDEDRYDENLASTATSLGTLLDDAGIPTQVKAPEHSLQIPTEVERDLVAVAIETVTNIIKHAPHSQAAVISVFRDESHVGLIVENVVSRTPRALDTDRGGRGLRRASQRLGQHGGQLKSGPTPHGWEVRAVLPFTLHQDITEGSAQESHKR